MNSPTLILELSKKLIVLILIFSVVASPFAYIPKKAEAQAVQNDCGIFSFNCTMDHLMNFVLNKLAVTLANQLLQKMTASIVNWINSGFEGSPAFLTNPQGFFLDLGDQITGEFLDNEGALSQLCSPFSFDVRLNIALNQSTYATKRYTCTLGTIIGNTQRAVSTAGQNSGISISADPNGATLGNFVSGDFNQGGWDGFMAYSLQPQNNPVGAELMARADLQRQVGQKKANLNADLNRGQGFMSWDKCTDITDEYNNLKEENGAGILGSKYGLNDSDIKSLETTGVGRTGYTPLEKPTSVKKKIDKNGNTTYQNCETQTPGSLIGGSIQRQLNVPADKLVLVKTISDSIDAMLGALVNQMLTQGLAALSNRSSSVGGSSKSYLVQLYEEADNGSSFEAQSARARTANAADLASAAQSAITAYGQMTTILVDARSNYDRARQCFITRRDSFNDARDEERDYAQSQIDLITYIIAHDVDTLIASTTVKKLQAQGRAEAYANAVTNAATNNTSVPNFNTNDFDSRATKLESAISTGASATQGSINDGTNAQQELRLMQTKVDGFNKDAQRLQTLCSQFSFR